MEYRYYRELKHNYLIIRNEAPELEKGVHYQIRMLERGNLKGFIPCDLRNINNENYLYYEINSMQSLRDRYAVNGMNADELRNLLSSFKNALEGLSEYLLGMENVILDGKSVYVDLSTNEYKFMYCPFKTEQADFGSFADELFELVDHDDEAAVEMIYSCSEKMSAENALVMDCLEQVLNEAAPDISNQEQNPVRKTQMQTDTQELENYNDDLYGDDLDDIEDNAALGDKTKRTGIDGKIQLIFGFLFMGLLCAMMYIRMNYILSKGEDILSIVVIVLSMITGLIGILMGVKDITANGFHGFKKKEKEILDEADKDYLDYGEDSSFANDYLNEEYLNEESYGNQVHVTSAASSAVRNRPQCGETIVLSDDEDCDKDIILYSRNASKTIRIALDKLPITIGKMEGCVDKVINDISVSRMHCRFIRDSQGRVSVVDLGSTNGTFRNGLRLNPQEKCYIEEGDEIRIGKICFDCR
ncbi:DUF6382 domain-containing protein [Butyrivibrio proteoclasticus]|uniref:DUF6382 domain-containing protein n=1 Tax=Butyrivibrio proteoclasticus TaxID=43305 RepID=UPI00047C28BB|nr:DUF6382 domain-containing protein [Butyrivibrio proteoclasticus]